MIAIVGLEARQIRRMLAGRVGGAQHATEARTVMLLDVHVRVDGRPLLGLGEAAPLPGYSIESLAEVVVALERVRVSLPWRLDPARLLESLEALTRALPPSLRGALEVAVLDGVGQAQAQPLWSLLRDGGAAPLPLCAVLDAAPAALAAQSAALATAGARAQKRKLSPEDVEPSLRALAGADVAQLRLDCNRAFPPETLAELAPRLAALAPRFVEEPVSGDLAAWLSDAPLGLRYAADESLAAPTARAALAALDRLARAIVAGRLAAVVLKPARDGLLGALALGRAAQRLGAEVVVTHSWDGARGHLAAVHLAHALAGPGAPAQGLWPHPGLDEQSALGALIEHGQLRVPTWPGLGARA